MSSDLEAENLELLRQVKEEVYGIKELTEWQAEYYVDKLNTLKEKKERLKKQYELQSKRLQNEYNSREFVYRPLLMDYFDRNKGDKKSIHLSTGTLRLTEVKRSASVDKNVLFDHLYNTSKTDIEALKKEALEGVVIPGITVKEARKSFTIS